ncbi:MAG: serine/threonine-protein kinase, partial [Thermodesulfobacteriota bacterium]
MRRIGKYEIRGLLGRGGMGKVYKARLPVLGKLVALKVLEPWELTENLLGTATVRDLFRKEAQALASLRHPHLAEILDFDSDIQGRPFFTQEFYCRHLGLVLGEKDGEAPTVRVLPPERAVRYALEIAAALQRLHSAGIIHRDIKPANILLDDHDQVKLIDLGLSLLPGKAPVFPKQFKVGTPLYAAPEQEHDPDSVTASADLYSLGVCLWRMLIGSFPPGAKTQSVLPSQLRSALGSCWDGVLTKAVAESPELRYQSADNLCADVQEALVCWKKSQAAQCKLPETAVADTTLV